MQYNENELLKELSNIVGNEWVSDEPELVYSHMRDVNLFPQNLESVMRPPFFVVLPGSNEEIQKVMEISRKFQLPIIIHTTGINITGLAVPPRGAILLDLKRMDQILSIDEANGTVTVQPYVSIARISCELQKKGMYIPVPGAPSTVSLLSNICCGLGLKVTNKIGRQDQSIVGMKMILPDGNFIKFGSGADPFMPKDIWPHGPGPDLYLLPVYGLGTMGILVEVTLKCWLLGDKTKELWVAYEDIDKAVSATQKITRKEICKGLNLYGGNKYTSYFTDTREAMERMIRANPEFMLIISMEGTEGRLEFEEEVVREIVKDTGGKIITDKFEPYESFVDSHAGMSTSRYSDFSMKYWGSRGTNWTTAGFPSVEKLPDQFKAYTDAILADPEYSDPDFGHGEFWKSIIAYPFEGGHYCFGEHGIDVHPGDEKWQELAKRVGPTFPMHGMRRQVLLPPYNKLPREGLPRMTTIYELSREIAMKLNPYNHLSCGMLFRR
ncbi:MAG: FAD-binding oxidoreductase [Proteobacteria bacterium]|nr:FAD-binding oxidoreductase [Pseudomonadota bacterium]